ncbi:unnamed protein product [Mytilus coruscus]|uniref:Uncharacterized protein n=1 Tax=Mytilus coruscus TaxID=42192 RepID=A0A6J8DCE1_MYTCO|nr:unnamed protein product [Mytilus coruscus]
MYWLEGSQEQSVPQTPPIFHGLRDRSTYDSPFATVPDNSDFGSSQRSQDSQEANVPGTPVIQSTVHSFLTPSTPVNLNRRSHHETTLLEIVLLRSVKVWIYRSPWLREQDRSLMGRDWLHKLQLNWKSIFKIEQLAHNQEPEKDKELQDLLRKYPQVFKEGLGTLKGTKARIYVDKGATPKYFKARPVPTHSKKKLKKELDRLEKGGNIEKVEFSEWAAPIVPIVKPDKSVRICGDYKVTINQVSKLDNYPIPKTDDLYATLSGDKLFPS